MPKLLVSPHDSPIDDALRVRVEGLGAGQRVGLVSTFRTWNGRLWSSRSELRAGDDGVVDLDRDAPLDGGWARPSASALVWSMRRVSGDEAERHRASVLAPRELLIEASIEGEERLSASVVRRLASPGVSREMLDHDGVQGALYLPAGKPKGAVLVLGGSSGEPDFAHAALLASRGFAALALAYFRAPGLPDWLLGVPVEPVLLAARLLRERTGLGFVAAWGTSRGAELSLLAASLTRDIGAVVSIAGSPLLMAGFGPADLYRACDGAAWTWQGRPLPSLQQRNPAASVDTGEQREPIAETPFFLSALEHRPSVEASAIALDRIAGPVLLAAGDDDLCWPSARLAELAMERLARAARAFPDGALIYPGAGHFLGAPGLPTTTDRYRHALTRREYLAGGSPRADAEACADLWPRAIRFLEEAASR